MRFFGQLVAIIETIDELVSRMHSHLVLTNSYVSALLRGIDCVLIEDFSQLKNPPASIHIGSLDSHDQ
jgi:hypothetical protein